jgi:glycosyltransferase involved in cell wall biosynthesis
LEQVTMPATDSSASRPARPLKVGINARLLTTPEIRGWNRYTINLLAELPGQGVELYLYSQEPVHANYLDRLPPDGFTLRQKAGLRLPAWEQRWLPNQCGEDGVDVLHSPFNFGLPWWCPCPTVLTLHDAIDQVYYRPRQPPSARLTPGALRSRFYHWLARTRASRIIAVSQHAKNDIVTHLHVRASRVSVVAEAADPIFLKPIDAEDRGRAQARHALPSRYFFYVGGWEGRKNIPFLLQAFALANLDDVALVLAGGKADQRADLTARAESLGIGTRLRLLNWVEEEDLPALYAGALAFVYPSEYEGFGLQLCEAMAVRTPCLAARATCLPEVLGSGGETFGLESPVELAALLRRVAIDPPFRIGLRQRAERRAADFSWSRAAEQTTDVYRSLLVKR